LGSDSPANVQNKCFLLAISNDPYRFKRYIVLILPSEPSTMLKAILIDDEINGVESLQTLIQENCNQVLVLEILTDPVLAVERIRKLRPDVLFLDIEMPEMSGFEMLDKIKDIPLQVIFTTAYDQYAVRAFKHNAVDYLLKPVIISELTAAVDRLTARMNPINPDHTNLQTLLAKIQGSQAQKLAIRSMNEIIYIDMDQISYLEADSNYTNIFLINGEKLNSTKTLKEYETMLDPRIFCRVFKANVVNLKHVKKFIKEDGGYIIMSDGTNINVSRDKRQLLLDRLASF
jgi:two-component system LytT family response regulator